MEENDLVRKLGTEKLNNFKEDFNKIVDKYRMIADASGYNGELVFNKEHGEMVVFVKL
jgi:hypothetical protein